MRKLIETSIDLVFSRYNCRASAARLIDNRFWGSDSSHAIFLTSDDYPDSFVAIDRTNKLLYFSSQSNASFVNDVLGVFSAELDQLDLELPVASTTTTTYKWSYLFHNRCSEEINTITFESSVFSDAALELIPITSIKSKSAYALIEAFGQETLNKRLNPEALVTRTDREFFTVVESDLSIAIVALTRSVDEFRCVSYLYVYPDHRRQGYGEKVFAAVGALIASRQQKMFLNVRTDNYPAINLYAKYAGKNIGAMIRYIRKRALPEHQMGVC